MTEEISKRLRNMLIDTLDELPECKKLEPIIEKFMVSAKLEGKNEGNEEFIKELDNIMERTKERMKGVI